MPRQLRSYSLSSSSAFPCFNISSCAREANDDPPAAPQARRRKAIDIGGALLTALTLICACVWFFPIYWALVTSFRTDDEAIKSFSLLPEHPTASSYLYILAHSRLPTFYLNSTVVSLAVTGLTLAMSICAGYAISQLRFPGRRLLWWTILASFMVPVPALIVNHFIIIASVDLINTYAGIVLPLLIWPVTVIVYKQFFDFIAARVPRGCGHRRRQRVSATVSGVPADELGNNRGARHRHVHQRLEQFSLALFGRPG